MCGICYGVLQRGGGSAVNLDPSSAQQATGGSAPAELAAEAVFRATGIGSRADSLLLTTAYIQTSVPQYRNVVVEPYCSARSCTLSHTPTGITLNYTVDSIIQNAYSGTVAEQSILSKQGVTLIERSWSASFSQSSSEGEILAGALDHSAFGSVTETITYGSETFVGRYAGALGDRTASRPIASAVWRGQMSAVTQSSSDFLQGDATLTYSVSDSRGILNAEFSGITNLSRNSTHSVPSVSFSNVEVTSSGSFSQGVRGNRIQGAFYGTNAGEIAGTFERSGILGAYGTRRQD